MLGDAERHGVSDPRDHAHGGPAPREQVCAGIFWHAEAERETLCVRACVCACVRVCVRACVLVFVVSTHACGIVHAVCTLWKRGRGALTSILLAAGQRRSCHQRSRHQCAGHRVRALARDRQTESQRESARVRVHVHTYAGRLPVVVLCGWLCICAAQCKQKMCVECVRACVRACVYVCACIVLQDMHTTTPGMSRGYRHSHHTCTPTH